MVSLFPPSRESNVKMTHLHFSLCFCSPTPCPQSFSVYKTRYFGMVQSLYFMELSIAPLLNGKIKPNMVFKWNVYDCFDRKDKKAMNESWLLWRGWCLEAEWLDSEDSVLCIYSWQTQMEMMDMRISTVVMMKQRPETFSEYYMSVWVLEEFWGRGQVPQHKMKLISGHLFKQGYQVNLIWFRWNFRKVRYCDLFVTRIMG